MTHCGHRLRTSRSFAAAATLLVLGTSVACTASPSPKPSTVGERGTIVGDAPICYGPGPNMNLTPHVTIRATPMNGGTPTVIHIATSNAHHSYRMTLPPGAYRISTYSGTVNVTVRAGTTHRGVDLPQPGCF
jgi:hypothetical protein